MVDMFMSLGYALDLPKNSATMHVSIYENNAGALILVDTVLTQDIT